MSPIAIIPARGGSKRIPRKNVREFCGKPLIAWSIDAARRCPEIEQVYVSTDDDEIAEVASLAGALVPFLRPKSLADDFSGTTAVVQHAVGWLKERGHVIGEVCCLYATAPLVRPEDLSEGLRVLRATACDYAFSVTTFDYPIQRALSYENDGRIAPLYSEHRSTRSQDLPESVHDAGMFYWAMDKTWQAAREVFSSASRGVKLPRYRVQDIDTEEDWERASLMFRVLSEGKRD
jgi:N-acylneuraminate cytidylyltransferase